MSKLTTREKQLMGEIKSMMRLAREAESRGSFSAAVNARRSVSNLRRELVRHQEERAAEALDDPLERLARLRRLATEAGSYVAASALAKEETKLIAAREAAQQGASDGMEDMSPDDILAIVQAAIVSLPDTLVVQLRETIEARLNGNHLRLVSGP